MCRFTFAASRGVASGHGTTAIGPGAEAQALGSVVVGQWNVTSGAYNQDAWAYTDPLFVVGKGTAPDDRSNALTVLKNGNTGINEADPEYPLQVLGGTDTEPDEGGYLVLGRSTGGTSQSTPTRSWLATTVRLRLCT